MGQVTQQRAGDLIIEADTLMDEYTRARGKYKDYLLNRAQTILKVLRTDIEAKRDQHQVR